MDSVLLAKSLAHFGLDNEVLEAVARMKEAQERHVAAARKVRTEILRGSRGEEEEKEEPHSSKMESK